MKLSLFLDETYIPAATEARDAPASDPFLVGGVATFLSADELEARWTEKMTALCFDQVPKHADGRLLELVPFFAGNEILPFAVYSRLSLDEIGILKQKLLDARKVFKPTVKKAGHYIWVYHASLAALAGLTLGTWKHDPPTSLSVNFHQFSITPRAFALVRRMVHSMADGVFHSNKNRPRGTLVTLNEAVVDHVIQSTAIGGSNTSVTWLKQKTANSALVQCADAVCSIVRSERASGPTPFAVLREAIGHAQKLHFHNITAHLRRHAKSAEDIWTIRL